MEASENSEESLSVIIRVLTKWKEFFAAGKRREALGEVHTELKIGSKIMFAGGIYGKVVGIEDETVNVEVAKGTVIQISRYAVQALADS